MMFQGYALYPHLSVRDNLAYPLQVRHVPGQYRDRRVEEAARLLGVEHLLDRSVQQISGGEQQRVAIGRAIVQKPNLYLLDEPISNLDASLRETVRTEVRRLQRQLSATMIMVTHDQMDALAVADRIAVLGSGVLKQIGTPVELYQEPANLFVARFIGNLRMNLLTCRYPGGGSRTLDGQGFQVPIPPGAEKGLPNKGGAVVFGFRPEETDIHLSAQDGAMPATVETAHFQGDRVIYQLRLGCRGDSGVGRSAREARAERRRVGERGAAEFISLTARAAEARPRERQFEQLTRARRERPRKLGGPTWSSN